MQSRCVSASPGKGSMASSPEDTGRGWCRRWECSSSAAGPGGGLLLSLWPCVCCSGVALRWDFLLVSYYDKNKMPNPTRRGKPPPAGAAFLVPPGCPVS